MDSHGFVQYKTFNNLIIHWVVQAVKRRVFDGFCWECFCWAKFNKHMDASVFQDFFVFNLHTAPFGAAADISLSTVCVISILRVFIGCMCKDDGDKNKPTPTGFIKFCKFNNSINTSENAHCSENKCQRHNI